MLDKVYGWQLIIIIFYFFIIFLAEQMTKKEIDYL